MAGQYLTTVGTRHPVRNAEQCLRSSTTSKVCCAKALSSSKHFNSKQFGQYKFGNTDRPLATRPLRPLQARTVAVGIGETLPKEYSDIPKQPPKGRRAGVVLHPTSLPGPYGMGEIGYEAFRFLDWLKSADMQVWQVLPLVPPGRPIPGVREDYWSPYSGQDASAGNSLLISLHGLVDLGLLDASDLPPPVPVGTCARLKAQDAAFPASLPVLVPYRRVGRSEGEQP
ncbi:4-alpha-glucanotransferase dpe1, chloroplastic/amyloplastic [Cymbomonas tetramitiformis]|uniref:4-alpha-glucanotransferase n=1 Tax=Cymbomonas tetramitiformis TaxID=36881 RepID=A0AAE0FDG1_9CHLO|nr:4-alpha-glucanotransferase dpe1, chloroplastic/amyloplastic [Cymbomonas tetramitiformis]